MRTPVRKRGLLIVALALFVAGAGCSDDKKTDSNAATAADGLAKIRERGTLRCGTRDALPGFAVLTPDGKHVGFDADFCRVIAAAILGDAEKVDFVDLATEARFTALQSGEIDVLVRNTTWTAGRDGSEGATFLQPNFYDGQGMMVAAGSAYKSVANMGGATVCVASGTTTEGNVASEFSRLGITPKEVLSFPEPDLIQEAFLAGRCDGWSSDVSQLTGLRSKFPKGPEALRILDGVFSKEPLAPAVADGDTKLAQAVGWAIFATIQGEEFGITTANVGEFGASKNPSIRTFLGQTEEGGTFDPGLGLPADYAMKVLAQVGNYEEIFQKHLSPLGLERGVNKLWSDGGLLYAPPYR